MLISIIHGTRGRPEQALRAREQMLKAAKNPQSIQYIFAVDPDDTETRAMVDRNGDSPCWVLTDETLGPPGGVRAFNTAAKHATGELIAYNTDDMAYPDGWDEKLIEASAGVIGKDALILVPYINSPHPIYGWYIFTRERYRRLGYFYFPEYGTVFAEFDQYWNARVEGKIVVATNFKTEHIHPNYGHPEVPWDDQYERQNDQEQYKSGERIFSNRWPGALASIEREVGGFGPRHKKVMWSILPERCIYDVSMRTAMRLAHYNAGLGYTPLYLDYGVTDVARNAIVDAFFEDSKDPNDTLVMLDIDHEHPDNLVEHLVDLNLPVVIPLVFRRGEPYDCLAFRQDENGLLHAMADFPKGIHRVDAVTTSAIAIQRSVIEKLKANGHEWFFKYEYLEQRRRPSEDLYFCKICRECDIPMYVDTSIETPHITLGFVDTQTHMDYRRDNPRGKFVLGEKLNTNGRKELEDANFGSNYTQC